jgi:hypothetical protein
MFRAITQLIRPRSGARPPRKKRPDPDAHPEPAPLSRAMIRLLALAATWLAAVLIHTLGPPPLPQAMHAGRPSPDTLVASVDIPAAPDRGFTAIPAGSVLISRGQMLTPAALETLRRHRAALSRAEPPASRAGRQAGEATLLLAAFLAMVGTLRLLDRDLLGRLPALLLFLAISSLGLLLCKGCLISRTLDQALPAYAATLLMPMALAPMLASLLLGPIAALALGGWVSIAAALYAGYEPAVFIAGMTATVVILLASRRVRTRSRILRIGLWVGLAQGLSALGLAAALGVGWRLLAEQALFAVANGLVVALLTLLVLPVIELAFGVSTDVTLLEFCDMQHPLLKQMAIEAPGTYHHSLMVANLAEAAAEAIGVNALLTRVSAYFHDVGKLVKPGFFSENIQFRDNPHDQLSPSMSTLVIISHVKEGVSLALQHKLPAPIVDAILEHHGTALVSYFFHKASAQQEFDFGPSGAREAQFRYPGPKPRSRETAILTLADAVEAASRSLDKITPGHIESLVGCIFEDKLRDGQFDACPITMAEWHAIRKALVFALMNVLHSRISYPPDETRSKQPANGPAA